MSPDEPRLLDLRGLKCPLPVLRTRKHLKTMKAGESLQVLTSDPMAVIDIPHMCREDGHALQSQTRLDGADVFLICKGR